MTVIAFDGKTVAADKQATFNGFRHTVTKIERHGDMIFGCSGELAQGKEMFQWIMAGCDPATFPKSQRDRDDWATVMVVQGGKVRVYERTPYPFEIEDPVYAIGSGREIAMTAMFLGFDARRAVAVACKLDTGCGMGVDAIDLVPAGDGSEASA